MSTVLSCYRLLNTQRIDGVLSFRQGMIHFEADFPSRHREHLPLHRLLGYEYNEGSPLRLFSDMGVIAFHPLETIEAWLSVLHTRWSPNRSTLQVDDFSGLIPLHEEPETPDFLAYLEGQWQQENQPSLPCAIQVYDNGLTLFVRGTPPQNIAITEIQHLSCNQPFWTESSVLDLEIQGCQHRFIGNHATQLWAFIHTLQSGVIPQKVWTDKTSWWHTSRTWAVATDGLWSFEPTRWKSIEPTCIPWSTIQRITFQHERLRITTQAGTMLIGQRYSNHFYRNLVELLLEHICSHDPIMAIWKEDRIVDIVQMSLAQNILRIESHPDASTHSVTEHPLESLWIPEVPDRGSSFVQLRVADTDPTPKWLIIHCGSSDRADTWLNALNIPSRRIKWSNVSIPVREGLFDHRMAKCCSTDHQEVSGALIWQHNRLSFRCEPELPLDTQLTFFFDDGRQQFRITTSIESHQDIPIAQWNLQTPKTLDVYNLRAYHRLPTHWSVQLSPVDWTPTGWMVDSTQTRSGHMVDMSVAGCAIQSEIELSDSDIWLIQLTLWDDTHQFLCIKQNSRPLQDAQWRSGFQFALPHMKILQMLWRTLQREHNQESEHQT